MNNKILSVVLVLGIASTGFAGISAANSGSVLGNSNTTLEQWAEKKMKYWSYFGKRKGLKNLTDEEKTNLESMTDEEKQAFFTGKKEEMNAQKEAKKVVIDKLVAGESLTAAEDATRLEMIAKMEENTDSKRTKPGSDIIAKILAGDALTDAEQTEFSEMQAKRAERAAQKALIQPIMEKKKAGEELTADEQATLDELKSERKGKKGHGKRGEGKGDRVEK